MALKEKLLTSNEFWEFSQQSENEGKRFTLIDGKIEVGQLEGWLYGEIALTIGAIIAEFIKRNKLGNGTAVGTGFVLTTNTVLAPDVGFIAKDRIPEDLPAGFAPDLAVEVVSPTNSPAEISANIEKYIQHGTRLAWIVYPDKKTVNVYRPSEDGSAIVEFLNLEDTLDGGDVLPGFSLPLKDIFPN